jgi:hypothetical protein
MKKQDQSYLSPFLVISKFAVLDGAEKALRVKIIAALLGEGCILSFLL